MSERHKELRLESTAFGTVMICKKHSSDEIHSPCRHSCIRRVNCIGCDYSEPALRVQGQLDEEESLYAYRLEADPDFDAPEMSDEDIDVMIGRMRSSMQ